MRGVCSWNSDSQALGTRCSPFLKPAALESSPDDNSVLGRCFRACCWCRRDCTGMCKPQTGTIKGSMQNGTFQTYPPLPAFTLHTLLSLRTSHISIYHYSCHSVTYKVFYQYMVLCDTVYYSKRNTKSTLPSGSSAQESSFHFSRVIDTHHHFGCCIPAPKREWPVPCEASSLTPGFQWHAAQDAASADASEATAAQ